jgi:hypothetical protein
LCEAKKGKNSKRTPQTRHKNLTFDLEDEEMRDGDGFLLLQASIGSPKYLFHSLKVKG